MMLRAFEEFLQEGIVKKQSTNKQRALSLVIEAKQKKVFLDLTLKKISADEMNANFVIEASYDIILELLRAEMFLVGYNSFNSHQAEISYMRILEFSEHDVLFVDELRYFRNGILYYGKKFDMEYAQKVLQFLNKIYTQLTACEIKLLIFDLGGILVENYDIPFFEALAKATKKSIQEIEEKIKPLMQKSERGEISEHEFVNRFLKEMNCKEKPEKFVEIRRKATKEAAGVRDFITELKKHYKVAFATNNAEEEFASNNKIMDFDKLFDWGVASYQAHARKTEPKMFEEILTHFKIKPEETIFIDDSVANLKAPKELGIETIHFTSLEQVKKELEKEGIKY